MVRKIGFFLILMNYSSFFKDRRLRSSSKTVITRRETGLVDSLCNTTLFDFSSSDDSSNGNKRERPHSAGSSSSKLTFSS
jgi:hypothetical protein